MNYERITHKLPPVWSKDSKILILGSIPSPKSRATGFYYGHPKNRFWKVLATIYGEPLPSSNEEKRALILRHGLALWDVIASCLIKGASDTSIKDAVPNDITSLLKKTAIQKIVTTGQKADTLYMKLVYPNTHIPSIRCPSTSPANCAVSDEKLIEAYKKVLL